MIGHEVAGEVVEVGRSVTKFRVGDRVAIGADIPCGECSFCEAGFSNNCGVNYAIAPVSRRICRVYAPEQDSGRLRTGIG